MIKHFCATLLFAGLCLLPLPGITQEASPALIKDGQSAYHIVTSTTASRSELYAAKELQTYLKACTGVELPVEIEGPDHLMGLKHPSILIGEGPTAKKLLGETAGPYEEQGYRITPKAPHLIIAGSRKAGTLYGVYDFLERYCGVRFFAPGVTKTPQHDSIALPDQELSYHPPFHWRHTSYNWPGGGEAFRSYARDNSGKGDDDHVYGRQFYHDGRCHSYFRYISPGGIF